MTEDEAKTLTYVGMWVTDDWKESGPIGKIIFKDLDSVTILWTGYQCSNVYLFKNMLGIRIIQ